MTMEYDHITALHYAAYRPSLHTEILKSHLSSKPSYTLGLDIGCGTGRSSISLSNFCKKVIGVDPSKEMLDKSLNHSRITYKLADSNALNFDNDEFDIITFAGSLFYAKSQAVLNETIRVAKNKCKIIIYDFEIVLEPVCKQLGLENEPTPSSNYDHQINFSGLNEQFIKLIIEQINQVKLDIEPSDLAHLLLSSKNNYARLVHKFGITTIYDKTVKQLQAIFTNEKISLNATTYMTSYEVIK